MNKQQLKQIQQPITDICWKKYKKSMESSINGKIEDKDIWIVENVVMHTLEILDKNKMLKSIGFLLPKVIFADNRKYFLKVVQRDKAIGGWFIVYETKTGATFGFTTKTGFLNCEGNTLQEAREKMIKYLIERGFLS